MFEAKKLVVEFIFTALFVVVGCSAYANDTSPVLAATSTGLMVMFNCYLGRNVSLGHTNPAVTFACYLRNYMSLSTAAQLIFVQFLGALFGYEVMTVILPKSFVFDCKPKLCLTVADANLEWHQLLGLETLCMFLYLLAWNLEWDAMYRPFRITTPLLIGVMFSSCATVLHQFTGISLNLARTFAAGVFHGTFDYLHIYAGAHFIAAIVNSIIMNFFNRSYQNIHHQ